MNYASLKAKSPSARYVGAASASALIAFTLFFGFAGESGAFAGTERNDSDAYAIRLNATRSGNSITVHGTVSDNKSHQMISAPKLTFNVGQPAVASTSGGGAEVVFELYAPNPDKMIADVTIYRDGRFVQKSNFTLSPDLSPAEPPHYTGDPISLDLKDADLRDLIGIFGQLTGMKTQIDDSVQGRVSVSWKNVPWDEAFDSMLKEKGLTYKIENGTIHVMKP